MKSTLIINDDEGQRSAELPKERIVLGTSAEVSIPLRSHDANLLPEHAVIVWNQQRVTWMLSRAAIPQAELTINSRQLAPGASIALNNLDTVELPGATLQFYREPEAPVCRGGVVSEFSLENVPVVLGRGENVEEDGAYRLELDPEDSAISKVHALIEKEGPNFFIVDKSRAGTELNGKFFSRELLVYGDRFRIGDYFLRVHRPLAYPR